jgi:hypothetical protein
MVKSLRLKGLLSGMAFMVLFAIGCSTKNDAATGTVGQSSSAKDITAFSFGFVENNLSKTYTGIIAGSNITVKLPYGIVSSAIASFTTNGASIKVVETGFTQNSGSTPNNFFTSSVTYRVTALDASTKDYTVTVTPIAELPDTAQTTCYNNTVITTCPDATFPRQDADFDKPNARDFVGPTTNVGYASDFISKDKLNGLTFKSCSEGQMGASCQGTGITPDWGASLVDWATANTVLCTNLNALNAGLGYAGKTNWRLPTINELANLVNYQVVSPTIDIANFPATVGGFYWTGTDVASTPTNAWAVSFDGINNIGNFPKTPSTNYVRCVSGDSPPIQSFTDNGDGTVTDNLTNLRWQQCSADLSGVGCIGGAAVAPFWAGALTYCNTLTLLSKTWRLPSSNELRSLVDYNALSGPVINTTYFPNTFNSTYWTSTTKVSAQSNAWQVQFLSGNISSTTKPDSPLKVRCVTDYP